MHHGVESIYSYIHNKYRAPSFPHGPRLTVTEAPGSQAGISWYFIASGLDDLGTALVWCTMIELSMAAGDGTRFQILGLGLSNSIF